MRLTKKKATDKSIELWEWLAETGEQKKDWPGWEDFGGIDKQEDCPEIESLCFLCEYDNRQSQAWVCEHCPYFQRFGLCDRDGTIFSEWNKATTIATRKKYAKLFLKQLYQLRGTK